MRMLGGAVLVVALTAAVCAGRTATSTMAVPESREQFLARVDAALASRDPAKLLALSDMSAWRESGRPDPAREALVLPPAPITRRPGAADVDVLYNDATGREWRLVLRGDDRTGWSIVLRDRACPPRIGMQRGIEFDRPTPQPQSPPVWTPLECWPLPK